MRPKLLLWGHEKPFDSLRYNSPLAYISVAIQTIQTAMQITAEVLFWRNTEKVLLEKQNKLYFCIWAQMNLFAAFISQPVKDNENEPFLFI